MPFSEIESQQAYHRDSTSQVYPQQKRISDLVLSFLFSVKTDDVVQSVTESK